MKNSDIILTKISSFYSNKEKNIIVPYATLCANHLAIINLLSEFWIDIKITQPKNKEYVIGIEDLTSIGKGKFVEDYFYENKKFVANLGDSDPYGFVTHWLSIEKLNKSTIDLID